MVRDLLLPATDAGAFVQLGVVGIGWVAGLWYVRKRPDVRLFVAGIGLVLLAAMGVRSLH